MSRRCGFTLVEALVALAIGSLALAAVAGLVRGVARAAGLHDGRIEVLETVRIPAVVLTAELRLVDPGADLSAVADDSIRLRAFRGAGVACGTAGDAVLIRYRGLRRPDPEKDSVLTIDADGLEHTSPLHGSHGAPDACPAPPDADVYRWRLDAAPAAGTPVLLYESGSYHLADRAFRYRRGAAGRQPLTAVRLDHRAGGFRLLPGSPWQSARSPGPLALEALVPIDAAVDGTPVRARAALTRVRVAFINMHASDRMAVD